MARALTTPTLGQLHRLPGWVWVYCARYRIIVAMLQSSIASSALVALAGPCKFKELSRYYPGHPVRLSRSPSSCRTSSNTRASMATCSG